MTRRNRRTAVVVLGALLFLAACAPPVTSGSPGGYDGRMGGLQSQINASRQAGGLGILYWDDTLAASAQQWAHHLAATNSFGHRDLNALNAFLGYPYAALGENLFAGGCDASSAEIHRALMASPPHRSVLLTPYLNVMGVGIVCAGGKLYVVEDFGSV